MLAFQRNLCMFVANLCKKTTKQFEHFSKLANLENICVLWLNTSGTFRETYIKVVGTAINRPCWRFWSRGREGERIGNAFGS